jgi:hypothetical protein
MWRRLPACAAPIVTAEVMITQSGLFDKRMWDGLLACCRSARFVR